MSRLQELSWGMPAKKGSKLATQASITREPEVKAGCNGAHHIVVKAKAASQSLYSPRPQGSATKNRLRLAPSTLQEVGCCGRMISGARCGVTHNTIYRLEDRAGMNLHTCVLALMCPSGEARACGARVSCATCWRCGAYWRQNSQ